MEKTEHYRGSRLQIYTSHLSTGRISYVVYIDGVHHLSTIDGPNETNALDAGIEAAKRAIDERLAREA